VAKIDEELANVLAELRTWDGTGRSLAIRTVYEFPLIRGASGRQRYSVLGAWNAVTQELVSITTDARLGEYEGRNSR
jgi:hypothetical protein